MLSVCKECERKKATFRIQLITVSWYRKLEHVQLNKKKMKLKKLVLHFYQSASASWYVWQMKQKEAQRKNASWVWSNKSQFHVDKVKHSNSFIIQMRNVNRTKKKCPYRTKNQTNAYRFFFVFYSYGCTAATENVVDKIR